jgi:hypothetical protein
MIAILLFRFISAGLLTLLILPVNNGMPYPAVSGWNMEKSAVDHSTIQYPDSVDERCFGRRFRQSDSTFAVPAQTSGASIECPLLE